MYHFSTIKYSNFVDLPLIHNLPKKMKGDYRPSVVNAKRTFFTRDDTSITAINLYAINPIPSYSQLYQHMRHLALQKCVLWAFWAPSQYSERRLLVRFRSHEIGTLNCRIALKFDRHIGSTTAEVSVKFQSDRTILNTNLAASRVDEILRKYVFSDIETGPWACGYFHQQRLSALASGRRSVSLFTCLSLRPFAYLGLSVCQHACLSPWLLYQLVYAVLSDRVYNIKHIIKKRIHIQVT